VAEPRGGLSARDATNRPPRRMPFAVRSSAPDDARLVD
jgi:hypothetical protein